MDITITTTRTYTEEDFLGALYVIKKDKHYIEDLIAEGRNDSGFVHSAKNQIKNYARKFGMTYMQACNLVDHYSWTDLGDPRRDLED